MIKTMSNNMEKDGEYNENYESVEERETTI